MVSAVYGGIRGGGTHEALACPPSRQPMIRELHLLVFCMRKAGHVARTLVA
jgi:hypothetical protein